MLNQIRYMKKLNPKSIFNVSDTNHYEFLLGAHNLSQVPNYHYKEVAFIGASNVGKSSIINAVLGRKIAIVSNTPGRTRQLNFFKIADRFVLVDMPGYGYAKANDKDITHWQTLCFQYLATRENLRIVFLLIDPIKGLKGGDCDMINFFDEAKIPFVIVMTKIDKISREILAKAKDLIENELKQYPTAYQQSVATSSEKRYGINELQELIIEAIS